MEKSLHTQNLAKMMLILALLVFSQSIRGETISEFNTQFGAQRAARKYLADNFNCVKTKITKTEKIKVESQDDETVRIIGVEFLVSCLSKGASTTTRTFYLSWTVPTLRTDNSALTQNQIQGYQVVVNGNVIASTNANIYTASNLVPPLSFSVRTVDIDGLISYDSNIIQVN